VKLSNLKILCLFILIAWGISFPAAATGDYGKVSLGFSFGTAFLKGDYRGLSDPGGMAWTTLRHRISDRLSHELSAGYVSLVGRTGGVGSPEYRAKLFGLDVSSVISALPGGRVSPYVALGLGVPRWSTDEVDSLGNVLRHSGGWGTNFFVGSGVEFTPFPSLRLRVGLKGRYYLTDDIDLDRKPWFRDELNDLSLEIAFGLAYVFGKAPKVIAERPKLPSLKEEILPQPPIERAPPRGGVKPEAVAPEERIRGFIFDRSSIPSGERIYHVVQVVAWEDSGSAIWTANRIRRGGYPVYIESALLEGKVFYRVRVGPYRDAGKAEGTSKNLRRHGYRPWIDREVGPWYVLQFTSVEEKAHVLAEILMEDGYPAYVEPTGFNYYRVRIGPFPTREIARSVGRRLKELVNRSYWVEKLE